MFTKGVCAGIAILVLSGLAFLFHRDQLFVMATIRYGHRTVDASSVILALGWILMVSGVVVLLATLPEVIASTVSEKKAVSADE